MDNHNYEQEIDLKDLMFAVFHKWRGIILVAVISVSYTHLIPFTSMIILGDLRLERYISLKSSIVKCWKSV